MKEEEDHELRRLTEVLRAMSAAAQNPEQLEALRMGAAAMNLVAMEGRWQDLAELNSSLTPEMEQQLRMIGLNLDGRKS